VPLHHPVRKPFHCRQLRDLRQLHGVLLLSLETLLKWFVGSV
jgi:hypothetical protein